MRTVLKAISLLIVAGSCRTILSWDKQPIACLGTIPVQDYYYGFFVGDTVLVFNCTANGSSFDFYINEILTPFNDSAMFCYHADTSLSLKIIAHSENNEYSDQYQTSLSFIYPKSIYKLELYKVEYFQGNIDDGNVDSVIVANDTIYPSYRDSAFRGEDHLISSYNENTGSIILDNEQYWCYAYRMSKEHNDERYKFLYRGISNDKLLYLRSIP